MKKAKERILEFLAVMKIKAKAKGKYNLVLREEIKTIGEF